MTENTQHTHRKGVILMSHDFGKTLMMIGLALVVAGAVIHFGGKFLALGRLPGDFSWEGKGWSVHFPLASSIVISIVLTVLANLFFRR
jgi:hypothetical protein